MRFQNETSVFKFLRRSVYGALENVIMQCSSIYYNLFFDQLLLRSLISLDNLPPPPSRFYPPPPPPRLKLERSLEKETDQQAFSCFGGELGFMNLGIFSWYALFSSCCLAKAFGKKKLAGSRRRFCFELP